MSLDISLIYKEVANLFLKELYQDLTEENMDEVVGVILEKCKSANE